MYKKSFNPLLETVSSDLGVRPESLKYLIQFESKWNPTAKNPFSSARGLIQFTDKTAKGLGYRNSTDLVMKNPTVEMQLLGPAWEYLKRYKPFINDQSLFMSVFYPKARYWSPYKEFPAIVQKVNPGIKTPYDYMRKVYTSLGMKYITPIFLVFSLGTFIYFVLARKTRKKEYVVA